MSGGASVQINAAAPSTRPARTRSVVIMTPLRETLSTMAEANGVTTAISSRRTVPQRPTAVIPPAS